MSLIGKRLITEEDRARQARREREERRKKLLKSTYGEKKQKHAIHGINSCVYGVTVLLILVLMLTLSYLGKGKTNFLFGLMGLLIMFLSYTGLRNGLRGLKEVNRNTITCKWGIGMNGIVLFGLVAMFIRGLM